MIEDHLWFWGTTLFTIGLTVLGLVIAKKNKDKVMYFILFANVIYSYFDFDYYANYVIYAYLLFALIRWSFRKLRKRFKKTN